jgi:hypothetical protein
MVTGSTIILQFKLEITDYNILFEHNCSYTQQI